MSWKDTLLDASFKGVGFDVIDDTLRGTHALAEHEYPFVQGSDIEDTGVSAMDMSLTAVLWGDDYESRLQSLLGVLRETGAGELIHPIYGSVPDCVVADFEAAHNEENPDYCTVRMTFKQSVKAARSLTVNCRLHWPMKSTGWQIWPHGRVLKCFRRPWARFRRRKAVGTHFMPQY